MVISGQADACRSRVFLAGMLCEIMNNCLMPCRLVHGMSEELLKAGYKPGFCCGPPVKWCHFYFVFVLMIGVP